MVQAGRQLEIRESDLPGVGRKFSLVTATGDELVIVIHFSGKRELFRFMPSQDDPEEVLELSDDEAHKVGTILAGGYFQPVREDAMLQIMQGLHLRWVRVGRDSPVADRSIRDLGVRQRTGASVIAIARQSSHIPNPPPDEVFRAGDTVIAIGQESQLRAFEELMARR
jgi:TrkA domain protein